MTPDELLLHLEYLSLVAEEEKKAVDEARRKHGKGGGEMKPMVSFSRPAKR